MLNLISSQQLTTASPIRQVSTQTESKKPRKKSGINRTNKSCGKLVKINLRNMEMTSNQQGQTHKLDLFSSSIQSTKHPNQMSSLIYRWQRVRAATAGYKTQLLSNIFHKINQIVLNQEDRKKNRSRRSLGQVASQKGAKAKGA